jgi:hypothetical protein
MLEGPRGGDKAACGALLERLARAQMAVPLGI